MANDKRFVTIFKEGVMSGITIIVDTKTGVNYLQVTSGYGLGLTPLLDSDGKVVIMNEYELKEI